MQVERLIERVEKIGRDPKYKRLRQFWDTFYALKAGRKIPIVITFTMAFYAKNLGINLIEHYNKPAKYVEDSLKIICFLHKEILDDRVNGEIVINFGEPFESSLFGVEPVFRRDTDPWLGEPIIKKEEDLENLDYPDFYESGPMPKIHEIYETAKKMVRDKIPIRFERWDRGPWGLAAHLRGFRELKIDTYRNPDFVHKLLSFVTESRIRWEREKERFLGKKNERSSLGNDEVHARIISPKIYEDFVYPYEKKLADFYPQGIFYFHSCGDITPFLDTIARIRGLRRLHISPVTDFKAAVERFGRNIVFEKRLDPINDLGLCDAQTMETKIRGILEIGRQVFMEIDPGPIQNVSLEKIKTWINIARKAVSGRRI